MTVKDSAKCTKYMQAQRAAYKREHVKVAVLFIVIVLIVVLKPLANFL